MLSNNNYFYLVMFILVALTFPHQAYSMGIGEAENEKATAHMEFSDVMARILYSLSRKLNGGNYDPITIQLVLSMILQRVRGLEKEKEERTVSRKKMTF